MSSKWRNLKTGQLLGNYTCCWKTRYNKFYYQYLIDNIYTPTSGFRETYSHLQKLTLKNLFV